MRLNDYLQYEKHWNDIIKSLTRVEENYEEYYLLF